MIFNFRHSLESLKKTGLLDKIGISNFINQTNEANGKWQSSKTRKFNISIKIIKSALFVILAVLVEQNTQHKGECKESFQINGSVLGKD